MSFIYVKYNLWKLDYNSIYDNYTTLYLSFQLRSLVFNFVQKELAPKAAEIDRKNNFDELRVSSRYMP